MAKRPHKRYEKVCPLCGSGFVGAHGQECCSRSCAAKLRKERGTLASPPINQTEEARERLSKSVGEAVRKKAKRRGRKRIESIFEASSRTRSKILKRLHLPCSLCGWNEGLCDLHHIHGRDVPDANNHKNLSWICPNHHRLVHEGKIKLEELIPLTKTLPSNWRDFYYGA
jgi:hypothetical protein